MPNNEGITEQHAVWANLKILNNFLNNCHSMLKLCTLLNYVVLLYDKKYACKIIWE